MEQIISKRKKFETILKSYLNNEFSSVKAIPDFTVNFSEINKKYKFCFAQKALHCSGVGAQEIASENADIYLAIYLRSFFELLILLKLCESNIKFKIALFVLSTERLISGQNNLIDALALEEKRLKVAEDQEKLEMQELVENLKCTVDGKEELLSKIASLAKAPYDKEFGIYNTEAEFLGLGFTASQIETEILPKQQRELTNLIDSSKKYYQRLVETNSFQEIFPGVTKEDLVSNLRSTLSSTNLNSWAKKAKLVDLGDEYDFVYRLTSDLIHSTSYSIFSKVKLSATEKDLIARMNLECLIHVVKILLPDEYASYRVEVVRNG